jgi:hypothetical protein
MFVWLWWCLIWMGMDGWIFQWIFSGVCFWIALWFLNRFEKGNFDSLEREILTVWKGKFWQFEKGNFDSLEREILTVWKGKFWQFGKGNFDSLKREFLTYSNDFSINRFSIKIYCLYLSINFPFVNIIVRKATIDGNNRNRFFNYLRHSLKSPTQKRQ